MTLRCLKLGLYKDHHSNCHINISCHPRTVVVHAWCFHFPVCVCWGWCFFTLGDGSTDLHLSHTLFLSKISSQKSQRSVTLCEARELLKCKHTHPAFSQKQLNISLLRHHHHAQPCNGFLCIKTQIPMDMLQCLGVTWLFSLLRWDSWLNDACRW